MLARNEKFISFYIPVLILLIQVHCTCILIIKKDTIYFYLEEEANQIIYGIMQAYVSL